VTAPTLFLRGESDGLVSADYVSAYARLLPNARIETMRAAGHSPHLEQPEAFARTALQFLEAAP
jgi:pimeloyl-ACP methyl ester carboxylesterase